MTRPSSATEARQLQSQRRLPVGAEVVGESITHFRVWAPACKKISVVFEHGAEPLELQPEKGGYYTGATSGAPAGTRYRFKLDGQKPLVPDPASRYQPEGPHGPSEVVDPSTFRWSDGGWKGISIEGQVAYELHIGTFTQEGTFEAATKKLSLLAETGITLLEVMPVAEFPGRFGWGYDGVDLFAPTRLYGRPDDLRRFVDTAHGLGMAIILDVVYNHFGPDGCYLKQFSPEYFTDKYENEWGESLNFDGEHSAPVRELFVSNAGYWIDEYHFDGLRLDATQDIKDGSDEHVIRDISRIVREKAPGRKTIIIGENEPQHTDLIRPLEAGGFGLDALWNDDFHHSAVAALTGHNPAYFEDHQGSPQELISATKYGYLFQGQYYKHQANRRGQPSTGIAPAAFVNFLENHDQIANSGRGERLHRLSRPGDYRAMTALVLLAPGTPLLFQGQEFGSSRPFNYFADHKPDLAKLVSKGRIEFMSQFPNLSVPEMRPYLPEPHELSTFERCKLDWSERETNTAALELHRDLLRLRREEAAFRTQAIRGIDGAVLAPGAFVLRFFEASGEDRLLVVNFGIDLTPGSFAEPLMAPTRGMQWRLQWSSEDPRYGGSGATETESKDGWMIPGHSAVVLRPVPEEAEATG